MLRTFQGPFAANKELAMRQTTRRIALFFCFTFCLAVLSNLVQAQTLSAIYHFTGGLDGAYPGAGVTIDRGGNLYGTAASDGAYFCGTAFKLRHAGNGWIFSPLYTFHNVDGCAPEARLVFGPDGSLYGTTYEGGTGFSGVVFNLRPPAASCGTVLCPWTETVLYTFTGGTDGGNPSDGDLVFDAAGNIYGTTVMNGAFDRGTVFELTRTGNSWTESVLYNFSNADGIPNSGVTFDAAGNLYGTTPTGGSHNFGTVFELSPSGSGWVENTIYSFTGAQDGQTPMGGVAIDSHGNLFGTSAHGGSGGIGTAWELTPAGGGQWTFTTLWDFPGLGEGSTSTPALDASGTLYGTLLTGAQDGEIFKLIPSGSGWRLNVFPFNGSNGNEPFGNVSVDAQGNVYGTTQLGGNQSCEAGCGVVFEITQ